jgi:hypothetical protein
VSDLRDDIYQVAALLAELERVLHPLALEEHGELMPTPALPPPLPPVTPRGAPPQGSGPGAPPRRSPFGAAPTAGAPPRSAGPAPGHDAARSVVAPRRAPLPPPTSLRATRPPPGDDAPARRPATITTATPGDDGAGPRTAADADHDERPELARVEPAFAPPIPRAPRPNSDASIGPRDGDARSAPRPRTPAPDARSARAIARDEAPAAPATARVRAPHEDAPAAERVERVAPPKLPGRAPRPAGEPVTTTPVRAEATRATVHPTEAPPRLPGERRAVAAPHAVHRADRARARDREDVARARHPAASRARSARPRTLSPTHAADARIARPALPRRAANVAPVAAPEPPPDPVAIADAEHEEVEEIITDVPATFWLRGGRLRVATDAGMGARTERRLPRFARKLGRRL